MSKSCLNADSAVVIFSTIPLPRPRRERPEAAPWSRTRAWRSSVRQRLRAGSATVNAVFDKRALTVTGRRAEYASEAESGAGMRRTFCPDCGTPVFSEADPRPNTIVVRAGMLDEPEIGRPDGVIWAGSAPSWVHFDPDLPTDARQPPFR